MKRKISFALAILLITTYILSGCSLFKSGVGEDLFYPVKADTNSFDPQIANNETANIIAVNCFEGLVKYDEQGKIVPGAAISWDISSDGMTYTFHIDHNAKWYVSEEAQELIDKAQIKSFDKSVTADDFVYGFRRYFDPQTGAVADTRLYMIKNASAVADGSASPGELGINATDSRTLVIHLEKAGDSFLGALAKGGAMPCREEFFLATNGRYGLNPEYTICNGPFYISYRADDTYIKLSKNEEYADKDNVCPANVYLYVSEKSSRVTKLENGVYDACPLDFSQKREVSSKDVTYKSYVNGVWGFCFNCMDDLLKNADVRIAICESTDVNNIPLAGNNTSYADGFIPPVCKAGEKSYRDTVGRAAIYPVNGEDASDRFKAGLEKLGVRTGSVNLLCPVELETNMRKLVQDWQKYLGVALTITIEPLEVEEIAKKVEEGDYEIAFTEVSCEYDSAAAFLETFSESGNYRVFSYTSLNYAEKVEKAIKSVATGEMANNCLDAENYLLRAGVVYPVYYEESYIGLADGVSDVFMMEAGTIPVFKNGKRV